MRALLKCGVSALSALAVSFSSSAGADTPAGDAQKTGVMEASAPWPKVSPKSSTDWMHTGNDPGRTRFSPLKQINKRNVATLKEAWSFRAGDAGKNSTIECT